MTIAYSYIRFSHPSQRAGDSFRRQLERAEKYCVRTGLELADEKLLDLGKSAFRGTNASHGALGRFIKAVEAGEVRSGSYLLIEALDRLSRAPPTEAQSLLLNLINAGIVVVVLMDDDGAGQSYDKATLDRNPLALLDALIRLYAAHEESRKKSDRFKRLFEGRRANLDTRIVGFTGPGWLTKRADKTGWELIPERADSIRRLFEHAAKGMGSVALASLANREGWPSPGGRTGKWSQSYVSKLLTNRAVLGEYQPMETVLVEKDGRDVERLKPAGLPRKDFFPPVVTPEVFNRVQALRADKLVRGAGRSTSEYHNVLAGLLYCGTCGARLILKTNGMRSKYPSAYYLCADRHRGLTDCPLFHAHDLLLNNPPPRPYSKQKQTPSRALLPHLLLHVADRNARETRATNLRDQLIAAKDRILVLTKQQTNLISAIKLAEKDIPALTSETARTSVALDEATTTAAQLAAELDAVASEWDDSVVAATIEAAEAAIKDGGATAQRLALNTELRRFIEGVWLWPGIAAVRLQGDEWMRWVALDASTAQKILTDPPPLPRRA